MTTRKLLSDITVDALIGAAGFTLVLLVMGSTVPKTVPTDDTPVVLSPPAVPVPVLDPGPLGPEHSAYDWDGYPIPDSVTADQLDTQIVPACWPEQTPATTATTAFPCPSILDGETIPAPPLRVAHQDVVDAVCLDPGPPLPPPPPACETFR